MTAAWSQALLFATVLSLAACGPGSLELPEQPVDRAATCGVVAAAEARAGTTDVKSALPFEAMGRILHYTLLAGSADGAFAPDKASAAQKRMSELQEEITGGKWQDLVPACRSAFPQTAITEVKLPADRFDARLGCYELGDYLRSALEEQGAYDQELRQYRPLKDKLDATIGTGLRARAGGGYEAQQTARRNALAAMAKAGPPVEVMRQCLARFAS